MTLQEALATGLRLRLVETDEWLEPASSYSSSDIQGEWEVEPQESFYFSAQDLRSVLKSVLHEKFITQNRFLGIGYEVQESFDDRTTDNIVKGLRGWKS